MDDRGGVGVSLAPDLIYPLPDTYLQGIGEGAVSAAWRQRMEGTH